jgi:TonB-linked SusC/RagA family outer membrane protein
MKKFRIASLSPGGGWVKKLLLTMKLTIIILFLSLMQVSATVYSQATKFTFDAENKQVVDVLRQIEDNSQFRFFYLREQVDVERKVSVKANDATVEQILDELFKETGVNYELMNDFLIVLKKGEDPIKSSGLSSSFAEQGNTVSGTVIDESGEPLPGVTVLVKGTTQGTVTNSEGNYTLTNIPDDVTLVFSFVGMLTQEIEVGNQTTIDVTLEIDAIGIEEVVAVGYGTMRKSDLTGSVTSVEIEETEKSSNVTIGQYLQGAVPGLNVGQVDAAGENPSLSIRGRNTLSGNSSVLIVVDGIIFSGSMAELNPADIESVNVLKDASSKAIYGAQAANGVILIETKSGSKITGKPTINYSTSLSIQTPTNELIPYDNAGWEDKNTRILWREAFTESSGYLEPNPDYSHDEAFAPYNLSTELAEFREAGIEFDWYDALTDPGQTMKHNLSVSGRTSNTTYLMSVSHSDQDGFLLMDDYNRTTGRINLESVITDWFTFGINSYVAISDYSGEGIDYPSRITNHFPGYDENGEVIPRWGVITSPFASLLSQDFDKRNSLFGKIYAKVNVPQIKGLTYTINYGNNYRWNRHYRANEYVGEGVAFKDNSSYYDWTLDNILSYM